jgi:hypothetical protein
MKNDWWKIAIGVAVVYMAWSYYNGTGFFAENAQN